MAALGCTRGLSARLSKDYAQPECLGAGTGGSAKGCGKKRTAHFSAIHERDRSRARTTDSTGKKKLAFMSDRSGTMEIWVSERDGSNPVQLTAVGGAGTPRWSPDSQWVAFDASDRNGTKIYKIKLGSGAPQLLTH